MLTFDELEARLGPAEIKHRKLSNAGRKGAASRCFTKRYDLIGGPLDGRALQLTSPNTAVFCMHGRVGRYTAAYELATQEERYRAEKLNAAWREARGLRWHNEALQLHWQDL